MKKSSKQKKQKPKSEKPDIGFIKKPAQGFQKLPPWARGVVYALVFLLVVFLGAQIVAADKYKAIVKIKEDRGIGVNPLPDNLDFGDLPKDSAAIRYVRLQNNGNFNLFISSLKVGSIAQLMKISRNNFILKPGQNQRLEYEVRVPPSANKDSYSGWVILFKVPIGFKK